MAWIEVHQALPTHDKTWQLADALDIPEPYAVGLLTCLWLWAIDNAPDGRVRDSSRTVARAAKWPGDPDAFLSAMVGSGFLDRTDGDLVIHDWHEYAGKLIDRREANAERMRRAREERAGKPAAASEQTRAENVQDTCGARAPATEQHRTEQNRTEEAQPKKAVRPPREEHQAVLIFARAFKTVKGRAPARDARLEARLTTLWKDQGEETFRRAVENYFGCLGGRDPYPQGEGFNMGLFVRQFDKWEGGQTDVAAPARASPRNGHDPTLEGSMARTLAAVTGVHR